MTKYRSGLEEQVADLLSGLGIDYDYESTKIAYQIQHIYTPDFVLPNKHVVLECKGYWEADAYGEFRERVRKALGML